MVTLDTMPAKPIMNEMQSIQIQSMPMPSEEINTNTIESINNITAVNSIDSSTDEKKKASREEWSMEELSNHVRNTKKVDKDFLMIVDGSTGSGKSTWAVKFAKKNDDKFSIKDDIMFSQDEFINKIVNSEPGRTYIADEAINILFRRDFMLNKQKFILKLLDMARDKNLCIMFCVPNFWAIDKHLLEGRIKLRVHIARTGLVFLWKPSTNPFTPDKWCRRWNELVCSNWDFYMNARKTKGFLGFMRFGDLGSKEKRIYLEVKAEKKAMIAKLEEEKDKEQKEEEKKLFKVGELTMLALIRDQGWLKPGAMASLSAYRGITNQALGQQILKLKKSTRKENHILNNNPFKKEFEQAPVELQHTAQ